MLKFEKLFLFLFLITFLSCEKSSNTGQQIIDLKIEKNILDCNNISYIDKTNKIQNHFYYGEVLSMNFNEITGFEKKDGLIYPGLELLVLDKNKDTVVFNKDLYADEIDGFDFSSFELTPQITLGTPIHSNAKYKVFTRLWDKVGKGTFNTETKISVEPYSDFKIKNENFKYKEIYPYSQKRGEVIFDKKIFLDENIYFIFEGLEGFSTKEGKSLPGASITVTDANGRKIFENPDLFKDSENYSLAQTKEKFAPYIIFNEKEKGDLKIRCRIKIWDKNDLGTSLQLSTNLLLVDN